MAIPNYSQSEDEVYLDLLEYQIEVIEEQIAVLEKSRKKLIAQQGFVQDDITRKGRMEECLKI